MSDKLEQELEELAIASKRHLISRQAIRIADNVIPVCVTVEEIAEALDFVPSRWPIIIDKAWELDIPICYIHFHGHYLGKSMEEVFTKMAAEYYQILGRASTMQNRFMILGRDSKRLEDGIAWAKTHLNCDLRQTPKMFAALGSPLPKEIVALLTDGG